MSFIRTGSTAARLTPGLVINDPIGAYWYGQAVLRLRREIAWCWRQRAGQADPGDGRLPPLVDAAADSLELVRYQDDRKRFFETDPAASYLGEQIAAGRPDGDGRWQWLVHQLDLDDAAQFVLGLGLAARLDGSLGPVFATCMNDASRPFATLALAQRLWDDPAAIVVCADPDYPLFRHGLLAGLLESRPTSLWQAPLEVPAAVARQLAEDDPPLPYGLRPVVAQQEGASKVDEIEVARLRTDSRRGMQMVPLVGPSGSDFAAHAAVLAGKLGRRLAALDDSQGPFRDLASVAWLRGYDVVLPESWAGALSEKIGALQSVRWLPLRWYLPVTDQAQVRALPIELATPGIKIAGLTFTQRVEALAAALGERAVAMEDAVAEAARRFRLQAKSIEAVGRLFAERSVPLTAENLAAVCAAEANLDLDGLAQPVAPRFSPEELVLPAEQAAQFAEVRHAMQSLGAVHYRWGTARAWNEGGIAVLFCGPPGTGKTMAAEALAAALDWPMFRVDLSQVVNKYIGETEKNLKRIFDAAERGDCLLFFDEADALFGKRTEVKEAHDRFANIEISYLLERMERFKGLAILATNRKKDLDEAFLRRLRFVIEFPMPGIEERRRIWRLVFPPAVDVTEIDFDFLARQFQLAGGSIRSIAFNACLRSANKGKDPKVLMPDVLVAVRRELAKMDRAAGAELFGPYRHLLEATK